jgi:hypothetical protein
MDYEGPLVKTNADDIVKAEADLSFSVVWLTVVSTAHFCGLSLKLSFGCAFSSWSWNTIFKEAEERGACGGEICNDALSTTILSTGNKADVTGNGGEQAKEQSSLDEVRVPYWVDSGLQKRRNVTFLPAAEQFLVPILFHHLCKGHPQIGYIEPWM